MEEKENDMNSLNTNSSAEVELDLDALLMSLIGHLYDAYSDSDSDSDSASESESESDSTPNSDLDSESDSNLCSDSTSDSSEREITLQEFLDQGSSSGSELSNSVLREKSKSLEFLDQRIISQILTYSQFKKKTCRQFQYLHK